jgi:hypothetical protein
MKDSIKGGGGRSVGRKSVVKGRLVTRQKNESSFYIVNGWWSLLRQLPLRKGFLTSGLLQAYIFRKEESFLSFEYLMKEE